MSGSTGRLIRRNPLQFFLLRRSYNSRCQPDPSKTTYSDIFETLVRDGICVIEDYMERTTAEDIRDEISEILFRLRDGEPVDGAEATSRPEYGCYYVDDAERHSASILAFVNDPMIESVASAYGGGRAIPWKTRAELRSEPLKNDLVDDPHADTWKFRFKAILYLTDVTEETSPFRYLAGSHRDSRWRFRRFLYDYLNHSLQGNARVERLRLKEALRQYENPAFREMVCIGPAGTLILFDSRGLHSATTLEKDTRIILNRSFMLEDV